MQTQCANTMVARILAFASYSVLCAAFHASNGALSSRGTRRALAMSEVDPRLQQLPELREKYKQYSGKCFVVKDNIDTDQIIPAEYLTLVPSKIDEYEKLGSYALIGLPEDKYPTRFVAPGSMMTSYPIIIAGLNFGCGSSREHAPIALGGAGARVVIAESYARIFFRNCIATGELYPYETAQRVCDECTTGDDVTVNLESNELINHSTGKTYSLQPLGDAEPVISAGGLFPYARASGMIPTV